VNAYPILDSAGLLFMVQSPVASADTLQDEVAAFVMGHRERIASMSEDDLEQHKSALVARVMEVERQLSERSSRWWEEIDRENFLFDTRERLRDAIQGIGLDAFRDFYATLLFDAGRRQLAIRVIGGGATREASAAPRRNGERAVTPSWVRDHREPLPG
jgi:secreted Zn-dependent insulinase-like peptidase